MEGLSQATLEQTLRRTGGGPWLSDERGVGWGLEERLEGIYRITDIYVRPLCGNMIPQTGHVTKKSPRPGPSSGGLLGGRVTVVQGTMARDR